MFFVSISEPVNMEGGDLVDVINSRNLEMGTLTWIIWINTVQYHEFLM